jgi:uncharacterized metal-binding protein
MEKKPISEIKSPGAVKTITSAHKKFDKTITINGCGGSSDLGQMTFFLANYIRDRVPNAFVRCPYALYPEVEGASQTILHDDIHIAIDGCKDRCLAKTFEKAGVKVDLSYALDEDFGLEKHPQPAKFKEEDLIRVGDKIIEDIKKHNFFKEPKDKEELQKV